jgi:NADPH-dependent 2,4-dienoyl-CoA reductase/sulfur reductase-like enzyme
MKAAPIPGAGMHYVIVGNGVAGATAAFRLRERERDARITLISGESDYFFSRTALMYMYLDRMTLRDLEPYERSAYDRLRIERVRGWVTDLDAARKELRIGGGGAIGYDRLLLATGSQPNRIPWPGVEAVTRGLVHFVTLQDLERCERLTRPGARAVVVGGGLIGVELVECLTHHGVATTFLIREPWYWPAALDEREAEMVTGHIRRHGVQVVTGENVTDVISENGQVRAVRTAAGSEYPCDILGVTAGVHPAIEWLAGVATPPVTRRGILVDRGFRTSLAGVFAAGDCAEFADTGLVEQIWYAAKRQGDLAARAMLGDPVEYRPPLFYNSSKFFGIEFTTVGEISQAPPGARQFFARAPEREATVRIVEYEGRIIGCNMLGSRWNHNILERWILERRSLAWVLDHLAEAQFDVEFGRLDLSYLKASA